MFDPTSTEEILSPDDSGAYAERTVPSIHGDTAIREELREKAPAAMHPPVIPEGKTEEQRRKNCKCETYSGTNLVVCIDGTSNQFSKKNTNVIELYRLVKKLPGEKGDKQLTYYNSGIGTYAKPSWRSWNHMKQKLDHKIDLAIAWNFERIVLSAYRWLSDNYSQGDRIYLFGFSRGAYQVRTLAAMIKEVGLLYKGNEEQIPFAYELYAAGKPKGVNIPQQDFQTRSTFSRMAFWKTNKRSNKPSAEHFKNTFSRDVQVHFVGVWDTVSSVGVVRHKVLPGTANGMKHVCFFRHALALDERRVKFLPEYVNEGEGPRDSTDGMQGGDKKNASEIAPPHAKEVWFVGTHSDVGGGNVDNELMDRRAAPLRWMVFQAVAMGLRLHPLNEGAAIDNTPTEVHESLTWIWWLLELLPIKHLSYNSEDSTQRRPHVGGVRRVKDGQLIHGTVIDAIRKSQKKYTPKAIYTVNDSGSGAKAYWEEIADAGKASERVERDLREILNDAMGRCKKSFEKFRTAEGQSLTLDKVVSDITPWLWIGALEEGSHALRENNIASGLLDEIKKSIGPRADDQLHILKTLLFANDPHGTQRIGIDPQWFQLWVELTPKVLIGISTGSACMSVAFSPPSTRIAAGLANGKIQIWDASTGTALGSPLKGHSDWVRSVAFSTDGTRVVSGSDDRTIRIWNLETGTTVVGPIERHTGYVNSVAYSPDGSRIVSGSRDGTIRIWDAKTGATVGEPLRGHQNWVRSVAFSPDGTRIASGSDDKTVRIWDVETGAALGSPLTGHEWWVWSVAFSPDGAHLVSGSMDGTIRVWDVQTGTTIVGPITEHTDNVKSVAYSRDGTRILSGSDDRTIRIWDAKTGKAIGKPLTGHEGIVWSVAFSPDGKRVVSGSYDCTVRIWDVEDLVVE